MQQFGAPAPFVGLDNYVALVTDPYLWTVVVRSIVFCVVTASSPSPSAARWPC